MPSVLFCSIFLVVAVGRGCCFGAPLENPFPLGTVGCLYTRHLCSTEEECIDDLLFGNCQKGNSLKDYYRYQLSPQYLEALEARTWGLVDKGYSWKDPYTQCTLQSALYAFRHHQSPRYSICDESETESKSENVESEISAVLEKLFEQYYDEYKRPSSIPHSNLGFPSKRDDEIVYVHKYFDKSPKPYTKKNYWTNSNYLGDNNDVYYEDTPDSRISLQDVKNLQQYFQDLDDLQQEKDDKFYTPETESTYNTHNLIYGDELGQSSEADTSGVFSDLPEKYKTLLQRLLSGEIGPDSLTDEQLNFLASYVNSRLKEFGVLGKTDVSDSQDKSLESTEFVPEQSEESREEDVKNLQMAMESAMQSAKQSEISEDSQSQQRDDQIKEMLLNEDERTKKVLGIPVAGPSMKKSLPMDGDEIREDSSIGQPLFRTDEMFMKVSQQLDTYDITKLVLAISNVTNVSPEPETAFKDIREDKSRIWWKVDPDYTNGRDAEAVVKEAAPKKDEILSKSGLTGVEILQIGLGNGNQDELNVKDDRYFVLTFVLCGCIAGILLAVVVIYLIRRHSRSKEKLAQLATVSEGTEASKDYQDLCRQRMQSKSSEKPEPLHAASRIGSVSETQVRSPSSRSSTSSWSEEPVTSNMDISTGHIVLSYMEDHLKNKDRLDREWEALCSYEADPASTKVASDSANSRKNRYSDILPYDHSRVVLSNASNITSSDYVNASSITDHDPRNPAYIATQGPLPHTVADFWQMVWEQGSVIIVMLSKLTENGEAMCHRYWPEEGSDLYHIYEVHLVSEHIWCDDYLVRSFYLKNLQTNETRTVTQFHFLTWPDMGVPSSIKALLDFRRKVNKSYRGRSCPVVVHCSDGCGRTGTYCLVDMVLNRMAKGAKEIDIAATLEHIRDQRMDTVKTKEQFQFALAAVAEEVHAILKALPQ
ncbi:receptor-type tyrosine-protein phosphatase N2-like isoform X2 [Mytilus edulis]|uniref:receptor-type tyrosine-protein phosphatase N2-like isoform X2 n=1 Tax=Mytilus edulis TaxID=6550 RepID=UPI0039F10E8B